MANKGLFQKKKNIKPANTLNLAGGIAHKMSDEQALAQLACTSCLNGTFYSDEKEQLESILTIANKVNPEYLAKVAVYAYEKHHMRDTSALLTAILAAKVAGTWPRVEELQREVKACKENLEKSVLPQRTEYKKHWESARERLYEVHLNHNHLADLFSRAFRRVIKNGDQIRNFVQVIRSGVTGRKSLGYLPRKLIREWFYNTSAESIFRQSVGNDPSLAQVIKWSHPRAENSEKEALFAWLLNRSCNYHNLPQLVKDYENFKKGDENVPNVPFEMLTSQPLQTKQWEVICKNGSWRWTIYNLNNLVKYGVLSQKGMTELVSDRIQNRELVKKSGVFPYKLLAAYLNTGAELPTSVRNALQVAMEYATDNVPCLPNIRGRVCVDVSGSMQHSITGTRKGATSKVRCVDVAALFASAFLRRNPNWEIIPFDKTVRTVSINPMDSIMTNTQKLSMSGGATHCSEAVRYLNSKKDEGDLIVFISDNESWVDTRPETVGYSYWNNSGGRLGRSTALVEEWEKYKKRNPKARLVCVDITPNETVQADDRKDVLNIGGFGDYVFELVEWFATGELEADNIVQLIQNTEL